MNIEKAMEIVKHRYGLLTSYIDARTNKMMVVIKAGPVLRAIPEVLRPEGGISLFYSDVIELAEGRVTIKGLVRRKNPEVFTPADLGRKGGAELCRCRHAPCRRQRARGGHHAKADRSP